MRVNTEPLLMCLYRLFQETGRRVALRFNMNERILVRYLNSLPFNFILTLKRERKRNRLCVSEETLL